MSAFNSRKLSFRMLALFFSTRFPPPNSHLKPPGRCPISASQFSKKVASHRSGKNHCGNFRSSAPQPPRSVNGQPCASRWKTTFFVANFGRWKTFRKVPARNLEAAWEGLKTYRTRFGSFFLDPFSRFSNHFSYGLHVFFGGSFVLQRCRPKKVRKPWEQTWVDKLKGSWAQGIVSSDNSRLRNFSGQGLWVHTRVDDIQICPLSWKMFKYFPQISLGTWHWKMAEILVNLSGVRFLATKHRKSWNTWESFRAQFGAEFWMIIPKFGGTFVLQLLWPEDM